MMGLETIRSENRLRKRLHKDLSIGEDVHSPKCLFIDRKHLLSEYEFDSGVAKAIKGKSHVYFRIIDDGLPAWEHGYATGKKVVQWG